MSKKFLIFIVLFYSISINNIASSEILPLKKPRQTKEETQKKLLIDVLRPLPKPTKKVETKNIKKKVVDNKQKIGGFILPKKKPLIVGTKETKSIKVSKYYSKKDFALAKKAIEEMKKNKWPHALKIAKKLEISRFTILFNGDIF